MADIYTLALERCVEAALARGDLGFAIDLCCHNQLNVTDDSEPTITLDVLASGSDEQCEAKKRLVSMVLQHIGADETKTDALLSLVRGAATIDETYKSACSTLATDYRLSQGCI